MFRPRDRQVAHDAHGGLLRHRDFLLFWFSETLTAVGGAVSAVAFPLVAVLTLHASAFQVGLLAAVPQFAQFMLGTPAGAWADRRRRKPVMVVTDLARGGVVLAIPASVMLGVLHLWTLFAVALAHAVLRTFFEPAWNAYLPALVRRDQLTDANAKLHVTYTPADVGGKGLGGLLVQVLGAPFALLACAVGFLLAALTLSAIRTNEPPPPVSRQPGLGRQIREGMQVILQHSVLRALAGFLAVAALGLSSYFALVMVFLSRAVGLPAGLIGVVVALGSLGGILGAVTANPLCRRLGSARWLWASTAVTFPLGLLIPLTHAGWMLGGFVVGAAMISAGITSYNIIAVSFTQTICPPQMLGRVHSVKRVIVLGASAAGSTLGGALGSWLGTRPALWITMFVLLTAPLALIASPLRSHRDLPTEPVSPGTPPPG